MNVPVSIMRSIAQLEIICRASASRADWQFIGLSHQFNSAGGFDLSDPWQCLYFFPDPQTHGAFLLTPEKLNLLDTKVDETELEAVSRS